MPVSPPALMLAVFAAVWTAFAIAPWYRQDWALENVLVIAGLPSRRSTVLPSISRSSPSR